MGLTVKPSFAAGELDPTLWERTTLDKYKSGCATARNVVVTKTGSIASRPSRYHMAQCKLDDSAVALYSPPGSGLLLEWGHLYVRIYTISGVYVTELVSTFTESDIPNMHFESSGVFVYVFVSGKTLAKLNYFTRAFVLTANIFAVPAAPVSAGVTPDGPPTGYLVEYLATYVVGGEESLSLSPLGGASFAVPILAGQDNVLNVAIGNLTSFRGIVTEMRVYRRPATGGSYGYIGSTSAFTVIGVAPFAILHGLFIDVGQAADYAHTPPTMTILTEPDPSNLLSKTGCIYQQRLLLTDTTVDLEAIYSSQPGYQDNFFRNYPLDAASSLKFKAGTSGYARVLRMLDSNGLVVFTSAGIFLNQGDLGPDNLSLAKKGRWVINDLIPPLGVPGGVLFVDSMTNSVRNLLFNFQIESFVAEEVSIYSNHLFRTRTITTWGFQEGVVPLLWLVFSDGTYASFTFEFDQEMKAWTRHDSAPVISVRSCAGTIQSDTTFFVVAKNVGGVVRRYIEYSAPRYTPPQYLISDPQHAMNYSLAYMDSMVSYRTVFSDLLNAGDYFSLSVTEDIVNDDGSDGGPDWSGPLNMFTQTTLAFALTNVGDVFRIFDSEGSIYDLTVLSKTDSKNLIVQPNILFDSQLAVTPRVYLTKTVLTGLDHLEGEYPAIIVDGAVVCSPNNTMDNYPEVQVVGGSLTLPSSLRGAIIHVGRPIVGDIETLDIDTVEQAPTLIESLNVNKLYIKVHNSQGLYVGNKFPKDDTNAGMESLDSMDLDYSDDDPLIGNKAQVAQTKRVEVTLPGDWKSQGKICIRQVDPLHFEVLSIIPDVQVLTRSDR